MIPDYDVSHTLVSAPSTGYDGADGDQRGHWRAHLNVFLPRKYVNSDQWQSSWVVLCLGNHGDEGVKLTISSCQATPREAAEHIAAKLRAMADEIEAIGKHYGDGRQRLVP